MVNLEEDNQVNNKYLTKLSRYHDKIQFLLIRRRHSLGMMEFIRGRYDVNDFVGLSKLFRMMSTEEIEMVRTTEFAEMWENVWVRSSFLKSMEDEFRVSQMKFNKLREDDSVLGLPYYTTRVSSSWETPEWGFPKGRRAYQEKNIECAVREFREETSYEPSDITIVDCVQPLREIFHGTNSVLYKHVYFLSILENGEKEPVIEESNTEIGDIRWCTFSEAIELIRPYHKEKKEVLVSVLKWVTSVLENAQA